MKKRFTEEQIIQILKEGQAGSIKETCRRHGIREPTYFCWRSKYSGMGVTEIRRLKDLKTQNSRLKRILEERDLEIDTTWEILRTN